MEWTDLKVGDVLAFTPEFLRYVYENREGCMSWFIEEVIEHGNPPTSFSILNVRIS